MRALLLLLLAGCAPVEEDLVVDEPRLTFGFPLPERDRVAPPPFVGVDHDPAEHDDSLRGRTTCTAHNGQPYPYCYDQHDGTDLLLLGGFPAMDERDMPIVAAADGVVVDTRDGQYDRCHLQGTGPTCDGHEMKANYVILEHTDGVRSLYWHMAKGSVAVQIGDEVSCGTRLGLVGSSGVSVVPHLHFELHDADGVSVDPFAGDFSQPESWWTEERSGDGLPGAGCAAP